MTPNPTDATTIDHNTLPNFTRVGVVGAGLMGSGIAEVCAFAGIDTTVVEATSDAADRAHDRIQKNMARGLKSGKRSEGEIEEASDKLRVVADLDAVADADLVIEAIIESETAKVGLFADLSSIVASPDAVLASNTSSIPIMKLAMATTRPENVVGIHFFNPVPVLPLVELVTSLHTSAETKARAERFAARQLDKRVIVSQDRAGFIVNALLIPYLLSAIRMFESGFASKEDIDDGMVAGCAHPMGPLRLTDLIGLDTTMAVAQSLYEEFKEQLYAPPPLLARMVEAGLLGRKTGRGFYTY